MGGRSRLLCLVHVETMLIMEMSHLVERQCHLQTGDQTRATTGTNLTDPEQKPIKVADPALVVRARLAFEAGSGLSSLKRQPLISPKCELDTRPIQG